MKKEKFVPREKQPTREELRGWLELMGFKRMQVSTLNGKPVTYHEWRLQLKSPRGTWMQCHMPDRGKSMLQVGSNRIHFRSKAKLLQRAIKEVEENGK